MGLIGIKIKDIKDFLKVNKSIAMPMISKKKEGEFVADGGYVDVHSYADYQAQVRVYEEFIKYLEMKYNAEVPKMFKAALTKVIALKNDGLTTKRLHSKDVTKSQYESFTEEDYLRTLNFISKAALEKRLLKPAKAVKDLTTRKDRSMLHNVGATFVLPVISENGVMVQRRGDVRGQFQAKTVSVSEKDALELRDLMIAEAEAAGATDAKELVDDIFELAASIGEKDKANTINDLSKELRKTLVAKCTELFGVDLSRYETGTQVGDGERGLITDENLTTSVTNDTPDFIEGDTITLNVDEIEMVMKNGKLIIKLLKEKADEQEKI